MIVIKFHFVMLKLGDVCVGRNGVFPFRAKYIYLYMVITLWYTLKLIVY